jgi:fermentation-respiration switch protein FrsA (DUF1100 family)
MAPWTGLLVIAGLLVAMWAGQRYLMYLPSGALLPLAGLDLPHAEEAELHTSDGLRLGAWFVPQTTAARRGTVIVFNGNAGNRSYRAPLAHPLARAGYAVLLFDYRGYAGNPGRPTEAGLIADALAAREYVVSRRDVDPSRLVYFGESLGTGVAVALAAQHAPAALVLRSPFTSIADVAGHHYWFLGARRLVWDRFDSLARRDGVRCPTLFIAGTRDGVVPFKFSKQLYDAWPGPKQLVALEGADHNDYELVCGPRVIDAVTTFADAVMRR